MVENIIPPADSNMPLANKDLIVDDGVRVLSASMPPGYPLVEYVETKEVVMEDEGNKILQDSIRDWVAKEGQTLREVLQQWADIEGWELVWNTKREYPLKASAILETSAFPTALAIFLSPAHSAICPYVATRPFGIFFTASYILFEGLSVTKS